MHAIVLFFSFMCILLSHNTFCVKTRAEQASAPQSTDSQAQSLKAKHVRFARSDEQKRALTRSLYCDRCTKQFLICYTCSRLFEIVDGETLIEQHRCRYPKRKQSALPAAPICDGKECPICDIRFERQGEIETHLYGNSLHAPAHPIKLALYRQSLLNQHQKRCSPASEKSKQRGRVPPPHTQF